jgi:hypothetical protein
MGKSCMSVYDRRRSHSLNLVKALLFYYETEKLLQRHRRGAEAGGSLPLSISVDLNQAAAAVQQHPPYDPFPLTRSRNFCCEKKSRNLDSTMLAPPPPILLHSTSLDYEDSIADSGLRGKTHLFTCLLVYFVVVIVVKVECSGKRLMICWKFLGF